jgi:hypothetical protein
MKTFLSFVAVTWLVLCLVSCKPDPVTTTITSTTTETATTTAISTTTQTSVTTSTITSVQTVTSTLTSTTTLTATLSPTSATTTAASSKTFGQLSVLGEDDFSAYCYRCHVNNLLGSYGSLAISHYGDAQIFLNEIAAMPPGGGIDKQTQWELLAYLLVQNKYISPETMFNPDTLSQIKLTRPS